MNAQPKISVVMATYNRADTLIKTISHLADQSLDKDFYEVIIIDDGSTDRTEQVVCDAIKKVPFRLKYLHHQNQGPGYTQNRGIREAKASVILLMADDIFMSHGALKAHLLAHENNPEQTVAVLGRVDQSPDLKKSVFMKTWDPFKFKDIPDQEKLPYSMFWACNISCKKDFMLKNGMYRDRMGRAGAAAHEDVELGYRLYKKGLRVIYCKEAVGLHHHIETLEGAMKRAYQRGLNWQEFRVFVPDPGIEVRYRIFNIGTFKEHIKTLFGANRHIVFDADWGLVRIMKCLIRPIIFNRFTVRLIWVPFLTAAENIPLFARLVKDGFYNGVISHNFYRGCREGNRVYGIPAISKIS